MNIQKYTHRLQERKLEAIGDINDIDSISLHHMANSTGSIDEVTSWHVDGNKWDWIGYGYWIGFDGTVYECRGYKYLNAGVKGNNAHIVSIGFQGDYSKNVPMPQLQFDSGVELIRDLKTKLSKVKTIAGHGHWSSTSCPGQYFPLVAMVRKSLEVVDVTSKPLDPNYKNCVDLVAKNIELTSNDFWYLAQVNPEVFLKGIKPEWIVMLFEKIANFVHSKTDI